MCPACAALEQNPSLIRWVRKTMHESEAEGRGSPPAMADPKCRTDYLTQSEVRVKFRVETSMRQILVKRLDRSQQALLASENRPVNVLKVLKDTCEKGSCEEICAKLLEAARKNKITAGHKNLMHILRDLVKHIGRKTKGRRHSDAMKNLHAALAVKFGMGCARWLEANLLGVSERSILRWLPQHTYDGGYKDTITTCLSAARMYKRIMAKLGLPPGSVPCYLAEDETSIRKEGAWCQKTDKIVGGCGQKGCGCLPGEKVSWVVCVRRYSRRRSICSDTERSCGTRPAIR
jgi:hypothetical protein